MEHQPSVEPSRQAVDMMPRRKLHDHINDDEFKFQIGSSPKVFRVDGVKRIDAPRHNGPTAKRPKRRSAISYKNFDELQRLPTTSQVHQAIIRATSVPVHKHSKNIFTKISTPVQTAYSYGRDARRPSKFQSYVKNTNFDNLDYKQPPPVIQVEPPRKSWRHPFMRRRRTGT